MAEEVRYNIEFTKTVSTPANMMLGVLELIDRLYEGQMSKALDVLDNIIDAFRANEGEE